MRLRSVTIHNYRSIQHLELTCESMVVFLGPNNHGKTNILAALEFALTSGDKPKTSDFFSMRDQSSDADLWVDLTFDQLTAQENTTWKRYLLPDGLVKFRKAGRPKEDESPEVSYAGYVKVYKDWFLRPIADQTITGKEELEKTPLKDFAPKAKWSGKSLASAQDAYIEANKEKVEFDGTELETTPLMGQKNVAAGLLPDFYLIPAVKDLCDETKTKSTTLFGRLLSRAVKDMAENDPQLSRIKGDLENLVKALNRSPEGSNDGRPTQLTTLESNLDAELKQWGVSVEIEVLPPAMDKLFELGTNLHLDDGVRTLAEQKGHGLQRAVLFAFIRAWAKALRGKPSEGGGMKARAASESIIFAVEEPELFLHPHAQRRLARALEEIAAADGHQVFLCSHSTHFVDLDNYKRVVIVFKESPQEGTKVRQCTVDLFEGDTDKEHKDRFHMAKWVNPERGEIFFAKRAVFVEGETETTVLPFLGEKLGVYDPDVSVMDCGSKHNLPLYIAIAEAFRIPYIVAHDEDPLPDPVPADWSDDKVKSKRATFKLNETIAKSVDPRLGRVVMMRPDFERAAGVSKTQGQKMGKALAALEHFERMPTADIPQVLVEFVRTVYGPQTAVGPAETMA